MKQNGITLLETLLSLAIAAIIITMSVRYFTISYRDMRVTQAVNQIRVLAKASYDWLNAQKQANFSDDSNGTVITLQALIDADLIHLNQSGNYLDPWGGAVEITAGTDHNYVGISFSQIPQADCLNLFQQLQSIDHDTKSVDSVCTDSKEPNTYEGEF